MSGLPLQGGIDKDFKRPEDVTHQHALSLGGPEMENGPGKF